ncbi:hypothetical protein PtrCC142_012304, partial [Pyrenophora tritici-repentis]
SDRPPYPAMVDIQPSTTFLPHSSLQLGVDTVMTDRLVGNTSEALMERFSVFNSETLSVSLSSSERPNTLPIACDSITGLNNNVDDIADTPNTAMPQGYLFQAGPAVDLHDSDGQ